MATSFLRSPFMHWACRSLTGHTVLWGLGAGLPLFAAFFITALLNGDLNLSNGGLTGGDVMFYLVPCVIGGSVCGGLFWFTVTHPLLAKRGALHRRQRDQ